MKQSFLINISSTNAENIVQTMQKFGKYIRISDKNVSAYAFKLVLSAVISLISWESVNRLCTTNMVISTGHCGHGHLADVDSPTARLADRNNSPTYT